MFAKFTVSLRNYSAFDDVKCYSKCCQRKRKRLEISYDIFKSNNFVCLSLEIGFMRENNFLSTIIESFSKMYFDSHCQMFSWRLGNSLHGVFSNEGKHRKVVDMHT